MSYLKISNFTSQFGPVIMGRAREYWQQKRARLLTQSGNTYVYEVRGSKMYRVEFTLNGKEIVSYDCNCPYSWGPCKHLGAALLQHTKGDADTFVVRQQAELEAKTKAKEEAIKTKCHNSWGITDDALYLLCYMAYGCMRLRGASTTIYREDGKEYSQGAIRSCLKELQTHNWIVGDVTSYWYDCEISLVIYFRAMEELFQHEEWETRMRKTIMQSTHSIFLRECAEILHGRRETFSAPFCLQHFKQMVAREIIVTLVSAYGHVNFEKLQTQLSPDFLDNVLNSLLIEGYLGQKPDMLETVGKALDNCTRHTPELQRKGIVYRKDYFFYTGVELPYREGDEKFSAYCLIQAAKALYEDRLDESIKLYQEAIKRQGKEINVKIVPYDPISFLLYVVALARRQSDEDIQEIRSICSKEKKIDGDMLWAGLALAKFFKDSNQYVNVIALLSRAKCSAPVPTLDNVMAYLLLRFFKKDTCNLPQPEVKCAVLQRELATFSDMPTGDWPYESVLNKLRIRPMWELKLQELILETGGVAEEKVTSARRQTKERLCYMLNRYSEYVEIREQNVLKSGAWGKGKAASAVRYLDGDVEMDDIDKQIHSAWLAKRARYESFPSLSFIIPFLKGTDKLLKDDYTGFSVVSVAEELPYIYTEKQDGMIAFRTNVPEEAMKTNESVWYSYEDGKITYYPLAVSSRDYFKRVLQLGSVPEEAEPMLEQLFSGLKGRVEIQSEIRGAVQLEAVEGTSLPILRIRPDGLDFLASIVVRPLPNGEKLCQSGKGQETITDRMDGVMYRVNRNLRQEKQLRKQLLQVLCEQLSYLDIRQDEFMFSMHELLIVLEILEQHPNLCAIEWPEGEKVKLKQADTSTWNISATAKGGWFELEGDIPVSENKVLTMSQLLDLMRGGEGRYIRLERNEFLTLSEQLRRQLARIDAMAQESRGHVRIPELSMAVAGDALHGELDIDEPKQLLALRKRIRESEQMALAIPDELNATLRDYQEDGFRWMMRLNHWGAGACLADDMGLGKTIQTIACLLAHAGEGAQMVVAPASVVSNWQRELARFAPSLSVFMLNEISVDSRAEFIEHAGEQDILVTTYGLLVSESETLAAKEWVSVCLDEAHTIKNRDTKSSSAAMGLKAKNRIILTGTPIQNHLGELWNLMQFINPGLLGSYEHFSERFITPIAAGEQEPKQQLKRMIAPFMLRRTKQEVARELPDKVEIQVPVQLSESEMAVYEVLRRDAKAELEASTSLSVNALAMITKLREAACSASLAEKNWTGESSKLEVMMQKLLPMTEEGNRVLIFSQFTSFLKMARDTMEKEGLTDFFYLDGSTTIKERQRMVEAFQRGEKKVFLISLKAGGLGLNLTGANYVIHLDPWWNPAIEQQATDRAYRIGQQQKVTVYHLISEHTIEEKILRLHDTKRSLADSLLEGTDMSHKLTAKELLELLQ